MTNQLIEVDVTKQVADDYTSYALYVNSGRALPSVLDGLKPVQRRNLYAMHDMGLASDKPFKKCARVGGEVMGKLHPHGDSYGTLVNMANDWANRYALIDGFGNFGTVSDGPASSRYTECRLRPFAEQVLLSDLDPAWIDHGPTYDETWIEPKALAARLPMLLLRDTAGIGVAAACRHVSYNVQQVAALSKAALKQVLTPDAGLLHVTMPDLAMGALIMPSDGMREAIRNGTGSFHVRAKLNVEQDGKHVLVVATELPQDVSPEKVLEQTYKLLKDERLSRKVLADARDESDRFGTRVVWELKSAAHAPGFMQLLWQHTDCQIRVSVNAACVDAEGVMYGTRGVAEVANEWAKFRKQYETKKLTVQVAKLGARANLLTGLLIALDNIKAVAQALIDGKELTELKLGLNSEQIDAIENMPLKSLRAKNRAKLEAELKQVQSEAEWRNKVLQSEANLVRHLCKDVDAIAKQFDDGWRSALYSETEYDRAPVQLEQPAKHLGYLLDNRLEGKEHTYYRSSKALARLAPVEVTDSLGIAVLMSNACLYWLPAGAMPVDAKSAVDVKELLRAYVSKPWEPGTQIVWSTEIDRADAKQLATKLWLIGHTYGKQNCTAKVIDLACLAELSGRRKSAWVGVCNAYALTELPNDKCVTIQHADGSISAVDLSGLTLDSTVTVNGRQVSKHKAKSVQLGNTTGKKRGIIKLS